jgi:hypothetical protein
MKSTLIHEKEKKFEKTKRKKKKLPWIKNVRRIEKNQETNAHSKQWEKVA